MVVVAPSPSLAHSQRPQHERATRAEPAGAGAAIGGREGWLRGAEGQAAGERWAEDPMQQGQVPSLTTPFDHLVRLLGLTTPFEHSV